MRYCVVTKVIRFLTINLILLFTQSRCRRQLFIVYCLLAVRLIGHTIMHFTLRVSKIPSLCAGISLYMYHKFVLNMQSCIQPVPKSPSLQVSCPQMVATSHRFSSPSVAIFPCTHAMMRPCTPNPAVSNNRTECGLKFVRIII